MISIRVAEQADLPALLQIYNEEVLHGTATLTCIQRHLQSGRSGLTSTIRTITRY